MSCDIVFVYVKQTNNNNNNINEFGCIVLNSINLNETKSFFVDFLLQNDSTFQDESDQIFNLLNQRSWICINSQLTTQLIQNAFQHIKKTPPQYLSCVDVTSIYSQHLSNIVNKDKNNNIEKVLVNISNHFKLPIQQCSTSKGVCELMKISLEKIGMNLLLRQWGNENQQQNTDNNNNNQNIVDHNQNNDNVSTHHTDNNDIHSHSHNQSHGYTHIHRSTANTTSSNVANNNAINTNTSISAPSTTNATTGTSTTSFTTTSASGASDSAQQPPIDDQDNNTNLLNENYHQKFDPNESINHDNNFDENDQLSSQNQLLQQQQPQQYYNDHNIDDNDNNDDNNNDNNEELSESQQLSNDEQYDNNNNVKQQSQHNYQPQQGSRKPSSWARLAKQDKNSTVTIPNKTSSVRIINRMIVNKPKYDNFRSKSNKNFKSTFDNNKRKKKFKSFPTTREPSKIKQIINDAIKDKRRVWISYNGHQKPRIPRGISPTRWDEGPNSSYKSREPIFYAIPYKSLSGISQKFFLRNVEEIRDSPWHVDIDQNNIIDNNNYTSNNNINNNDNSNYNENNNNNANKSNYIKSNNNNKNKDDNSINAVIDSKLKGKTVNQDSSNSNLNDKPKSKNKKTTPDK